MTVERERHLTRFACDGARCRANYEAFDATFQDAWAEARAHGWVCAESRGTWQHYCKTCKKELGDD